MPALSSALVQPHHHVERRHDRAELPLRRSGSACCELMCARAHAQSALKRDGSATDTERDARWRSDTAQCWACPCHASITSEL